MKLSATHLAGGLALGAEAPDLPALILLGGLFHVLALLACLPRGSRPCGQSAGGGLGDPSCQSQ